MQHRPQAGRPPLGGQRTPVPVRPEHAEDSCFICDLLGHLGRGGKHEASLARTGVPRHEVVPKALHLVGVQAAALQAVAPEGQHAVLQTH